jgi:very-short-patch-repair endonuclease
VTRARETLFFVADFNECRKQQGILGQFTAYTEKINLLRNTSMEELQLFGWIVMQGLMPEIHPKIRDIEVDFVLTNGGTRLAIEVDGDQHLNTTVQDAARDAFLVGAGYRVLRVKARDVRDAPAVVLARIGRALEIQEDAWDFSGLDVVSSGTD